MYAIIRSGSKQYRVKKGDTLGHIANWYGCRAADIRNWNDIPYGRLIVVGSRLTVWVDKGNVQKFQKIDDMTFAQKEEGVSKPVSQISESSSEGTLHYVVKEGDTLDKIAAANKVSVQQLKRWNKLRTSRINVGQNLSIYPGAESVGLQQAPKREARTGQTADGTVVYVVKKGDTLYDIAKANNVNASDLKSWNDITRNTIFAGQELIIRKNSPDIVGSGLRQ